LLRYNKQDPKLLELAALQQQASSRAPEPEKLWSLLCCNSKQAQELPELAALQQASSGQALDKLRSSLRCLPLQTKQTQKKIKK